MRYKDVNQLPAVEVPPPFGRSIRLVFAPESDAEVNGFLVLRTDLHPHSRADRHMHEAQTEIMYVSSGRGFAHFDDAVHPLAPDTCFFAPPGVYHWVDNPYDEPLKVFCVFVPPVSARYLQEAIERAQQ